MHDSIGLSFFGIHPFCSGFGAQRVFRQNKENRTLSSSLASFLLDCKGLGKKIKNNLGFFVGFFGFLPFLFLSFVFF